ncbi:ABC transporter permease [Luethyella okanaganae]|uniref:ABC transporter permease n=1 Tax=Luethyella okanaganae TaxID=69372 RepID=A0ABW1VEQ7_9MICO
MTIVSAPVAARPSARHIELSDLLIWLILAGLVAINFALQPSFFELANLQFIFGTSLVLLFAAAAAGYLMLIAEIDLSIGAVLTLVNVTIATVAPGDALLAIVVAAAVGVGCGLVSGSLVAVVRLPSIIVTLALSTVWGGIALFILPRPGGAVPAEFGEWMNSSLPMIATLLLGAGAAWFSRSPAGRRVYGLGSDELGAFLSGIPLVRTKILVFLLSGLLLGVAGVALSGITSAGDPLSGQPYTLKAITAAVLGGISFAGGRGLIHGALGGALALTLITNVVQLAGVSSFYQGIVDGSLLILALSLSRIVTGRWIPLGRTASKKDSPS